MGRIIGIDLGTTNSLVAFWENGESRLIPNALGEYLTPSVVSVDKDGTVYVGKVAKERLITDPTRTVSVFKRSMGTDRTYDIGGKWYRAEELSAMVLKRLKEDAESYLGEVIEEAIISVPAYFNDLARKATRKAGQLAGLKVERIINEPSAAALACQQSKMQEEATLLVFDFGGGTLDISLVECIDNVIEIVAVSGNNHLGGSDFDKAIAEYFCRENGLIFGVLERDHQEIVLKCAERAKRDLTLVEEAVMRVAFDGKEWEQPISRKKLIEISGPIFKKISAPVKRVLADGGISPSELTQVVMVGGSCKMPVVQQYLRYMMKEVDLAIANPDYMIALGIGVYAGIKEQKQDIKDMILTDICPFSLGISTLNKSDPKKDYVSFLIQRNSALPASHEGRYYTVSDNQTRLAVKVYQGEDMYAENNLFLGETTVPVPAAPKGKEFMDVRFTYDINGLLVIDVQVPSTGWKRQMVFVNGVSMEADDEIKKQMKDLEKLKLAPQEEESNKLILSRAEALYAQLTGLPKMILEEQLKRFNLILTNGSKSKIMKASKGLMALMDQLEMLYLQKAEVEDNVDDFEAWFSRLEESEDDEEVEDWGKIYYTS